MSGVWRLRSVVLAEEVCVHLSRPSAQCWPLGCSWGDVLTKSRVTGQIFRACTVARCTSLWWGPMVMRNSEMLMSLFFVLFCISFSFLLSFLSLVFCCDSQMTRSIQNLRLQLVSVYHRQATTRTPSVSPSFSPSLFLSLFLPFNLSLFLSLTHTVSLLEIETLPVKALNSIS